MLKISLNSLLVALMDLGFSSHAFHPNSRLVFMEATLSSDRKTLSILSPPNNRVFPPGPGTYTLFIRHHLCYLVNFIVVIFRVHLLDHRWRDKRRIPLDGWKRGFATR